MSEYDDKKVSIMKEYWECFCKPIYSKKRSFAKETFHKLPSLIALSLFILFSRKGGEILIKVVELLIIL